MSDLYTVSTQAVCVVVQSAVSKLMGYPKEGVDIGRGIHVKHDKASGNGWTLHAFPIEKELDKDGNVVDGGKIFTRIVDPDLYGNKELLSESELSYLRNKFSNGSIKP